MARRMGRSLALASTALLGLAVVRHPCACERGFRPSAASIALDEIAQAFAVLGRDGDRLAQPQLVGVVEALGAGAPLALVGDEDDGPPGLAHDARERRIGGHHAVAGVEHEQHQVRTRDRRLALGAHARGDAARRRFLQPGRVDERDLVAGDLRLALATVARQARHVGDERGALGREPVEERRLADIGPADDGDGWGHVGSCDQGRRAPGTRPGWRGHALIGRSAAGRQCRLGAEGGAAASSASANDRFGLNPEPSPARGSPPSRSMSTIAPDGSRRYHWNRNPPFMLYPSTFSPKR